MLIFLTIITLQISCLILPGPDFFVVISNSIKFGQKHGIITATGIGIGILLNTFIVYWLGSFLLYKQPTLFKIVILIGASYLLYIAFGLFKSVFSKTELNPNAPEHIQNIKNLNSISKTKCFFMGTFTNLANVKVFVFFSSMLSLVDELSKLWVFIVWISIAGTTFIWFAIVASFFGNYRLRETFFRHLKKIEFVSGIFVLSFVTIILFELFS